eukprot:GDKK01063258.1.p1 GENE.GDKK01063258.1~~GDKK01063258.1.p1  ORF type:complete len:818 (+),score=197.94 GDKK01063258.1:32-2485(+)
MESVCIGGINIRLQRKLAEGGFGIVYIGEDYQGVTYAIKKVICHDNQGFSEAMHEVEMLKRVTHQNIMRMYGHEVKQISREKKELFLLLEYCSGGTLFNKAAQRNLINDHSIATWMKFVCAGVAHMHSLGLSHWDLKPENVLFDSRGNPKLCDFGSCSLSDYHPSKMSKHDRDILNEYVEKRTSLSYRAPEMLNEFFGGRPVGKWADIWMIGCILLVLLTGEMPFTTSLSIISAKYTPPKYVSPCMLYLLDRCLDPSPLNRPSAAELETAFEALSGGGARGAEDLVFLMGKMPTASFESLSRIIDLEGRESVLAPFLKILISKEKDEEKAKGVEVDSSDKKEATKVGCGKEKASRVEEEDPQEEEGGMFFKNFNSHEDVSQKNVVSSSQQTAATYTTDNNKNKVSNNRNEISASVSEAKSKTIRVFIPEKESKKTNFFSPAETVSSRVFTSQTSLALKKNKTPAQSNSAALRTVPLSTYGQFQNPFFDDPFNNAQNDSLDSSSGGLFSSSLIVEGKFGDQFEDPFSASSLSATPFNSSPIVGDVFQPFAAPTFISAGDVVSHDASTFQSRSQQDENPPNKNNDLFGFPFARSAPLTQETTAKTEKLKSTRTKSLAGFSAEVGSKQVNTQEQIKIAKAPTALPTKDFLEAPKFLPPPLVNVSSSAFADPFKNSPMKTLSGALGVASPVDPFTLLPSPPCKNKQEKDSFEMVNDTGLKKNDFSSEFDDPFSSFSKTLVEKKTPGLGAMEFALLASSKRDNSTKDTKQNESLPGSENSVASLVNHKGETAPPSATSTSSNTLGIADDVWAALDALAIKKK